jgi:hypothetical protein
VLIIIIIAMSAFSPIVPGVMSWIVFPRFAKHNIIYRFSVLWLITLSLSFMYASREVSRGAFDDFGNVYYDRYIDIQKNGLKVLGSRIADVGNISKVEVLYDVLLLVIAQYPGRLNPNAVIFLTTLCIGTLYQIWCVAYFGKDLNEKSRERIIACCLVLFSFGLCSQTARQMLSVPFLLMAIWEKKHILKFSLLILAAASHSSAVVVYLLYVLFKLFPRLSFVFSLTCVVMFSGSGMEIVQDYINSDGEGAIDKLQYYGTGAALEHESINLKYIGIPVALYVIAIWFYNSVGSCLYSLASVGLFVYVTLINVPLASYRATLFLTGALIGPIFGKAQIKSEWLGIGSLWLPNLLSLAMIAKRFLSGRDGELMSLWYKYDLIGDSPFYYLKSLVEGASP